MKNIFLTGATGFLGSYLLKRFLEDENITPFILIRSKQGISARERIEKILSYFYGASKYGSMLNRIRIIEGEIDRKNFGVDDNTKKVLIKEIDEIYHSAAMAEFRIQLDKIRKINVEGTRNVFEFAMECKRVGRLRNLNHISTAFIAGNKETVFYEKDLNIGQKFNNTYEQSKFEAEILAHEYKNKGLEITIFRPSILTGDSVTGRTSNFKMLYQPLHFFASELFERVPANRNTQANLIAVDTAAEMIYQISSKKESIGNTYNVVHRDTVQLGYFFDRASDFFGFRKLEFIPLKDFNMECLTFVQQTLLEPFIPYFDRSPTFDFINVKKILADKNFNYPIINDDFLLKLFKFCSDSGYIKLKKRYVAAG